MSKSVQKKPLSPQLKQEITRISLAYNKAFSELKMEKKSFSFQELRKRYLKVLLKL